MCSAQVSTDLCSPSRCAPDQAVMLADTNQLVRRLICAQICARDAAGWVETREMQRTRHEHPPSVRRGQRGDQRRRETGETHIVWLITQRSRVQIPPPLLISAGQGPFPMGERASCVPGAAVRRVVGTTLRAAWQRDGGDGVTRDETAWTWWTLPPAIAGCFAQRSHRHLPVSSCPYRTRPRARSRG